MALSWLIDTSAYVRLARTPDADVWAERLERGLVRISTTTRLELGYTARTGAALRADRGRAPLSFMPVEYLTPAVEDRAVEVQAILADQGHHRATSIPDLLVAATAEIAGLTVLQVDKDFDLIARVTAQPIERLRLP